jgi:hypothetical protein
MPGPTLPQSLVSTINQLPEATAIMMNAMSTMRPCDSCINYSTQFLSPHLLDQDNLPLDYSQTVHLAHQGGMSDDDSISPLAFQSLFANDDGPNIHQHFYDKRYHTFGELCNVFEISHNE